MIVEALRRRAAARPVSARMPIRARSCVAAAAQVAAGLWAGGLATAVTSDGFRTGCEEAGGTRGRSHHPPSADTGVDAHGDDA